VRRAQTHLTRRPAAPRISVNEPNLLVSCLSADGRAASCRPPPRPCTVAGRGSPLTADSRTHVPPPLKGFSWSAPQVPVRATKFEVGRHRSPSSRRFPAPRCGESDGSIGVPPEPHAMRIAMSAAASADPERAECESFTIAVSARMMTCHSSGGSEDGILAETASPSNSSRNSRNGPHCVKRKPPELRYPHPPPQSRR